MRPATAPQPQPWAPAPLTPTELHAGHAYLPGSIDWLRRLAETLRGEADDLDTKAYDAFALAARKRQEALDVDRLLALAESDQAGLVPPDFFAVPELPHSGEGDPDWNHQPESQQDDRPVHYAPGLLFHAICGNQTPNILISPTREDMTCVDCIAALPAFEACDDTVPMPAVGGAR